MSKSVFFSWGKDRELKDVFVKALKNYLGGEDTVWESDSDCAGEITAACERAIKNATVFVVLLSDRAMKTSEWIRWEIGLAQEHYGESDYARYIVPIFWSGDFEEKEPFRTLRKSVSGIDNLKGAEMPDEGVLEALCKKVCRAINEHGVENYYASDLFSKESMLDLVQENSEDVRDGRCNFDEIWTERTVRELDEYGRVKSEGDEEEEIGGEQLLQDGPSLLIGEGGSGKSWLMRKTIYALLQERAEKLIFEVKFRDFSDWQAQTSDRNKLEAYLFERFCANAHVFGYTKLNFSALLSESELYLLIDGLDEVVWDKQKTEALQAIGHFLEKYPKAKKHTLYTSRNYSDRNRVGANKVYRLLPLDERQRGELIDHLFVYLRKEGEQDGFVLALSHINEEIRANPFFLTQLAKIYAAEGILPQHYSEIYEKSVNQFLSRERGSSIPMGLRDRLPKAAYYKYTADNVGRNMKFEHAYLAACDRSEETANRDLRFLKERSIIRNDNFVYQVFMDFYVAKYILTLACEQDEYGDAVLREKAIEKLKESLGRTENWDNITKIVLSMVETHYAELFGEIFGLLCGSGRYELLLDTARDILLGEGIRKISREVAAKELLVRTMKGEYAPYGEQFCYVPQYELYGETAKAVTEHAGKKELSLLRDVCFVYAAANTIEEAEGVTEEMSAQLREACAAQYPEGNTQRGMLCRLFYGLERASAAELSKRFVAVYPREFCVLHAANRMSGEHVSAHKAKRFEDEEGLFDADRAGEPIGLVAFSYDLNQLPKRDYGRVTGLILLPTEKRKLLPIGEAMPRLLYYSMPDNIQSVGKYAINFCPKLREVSMASGIKKFEANWCVTGRNLRLDYVCCKSLSEKTSALYIPKFVERVRLPKGLREIGWFAFEGCTSLQKIVLPEGLREIEGCAFEGCTSLQSIVLPKGLKRIGGFAFEGCTSLQKIVLPEGLREIGWNAFEGCTSLQKIVLPEGLREIGVQAFKGCTSLQRIVLPEGLQEIWWYAFEDCASLREIVLPKGLQVIQDNAFKGCTSMQTIDLPEGLREIGERAFADCTSLQTIDLPEGLQVIGDYAFADCTSLQTIVLPKGLKRIDAYAFANCTALRLSGFPDSLEVLEEGAFAGCGQEIQALVEDWNKRHEVLVIPAGTKKIEAGAFQNNTSICKVILPKGLREIGRNAFANCTSLREIVLLEGLRGIEHRAFEGCTSLQTIDLPKGLQKIERDAFAGCTSLREVVLPEGLQEIEESAFEGCTSLQTIDLPEGLQKIGERAFEGCTSLQTIDLPEGLQKIGERAFEGCTSLREIVLPKGLKRIEAYAFANCTALRLSGFPDSLEFVGGGAFAGCGQEIQALVEDWNKGKETLVIPAGAKAIKKGAFRNSIAIRKVILPEGLREIGEGAFYGCTSLQEIVLPEGLQEIEESAFEGCTSLQTIDLPEGLQKIGERAFERCTSLQTIDLPEGLRKIGWNAFEDCTSLQTIELPKGLQKIERGAFAGCTSLREVVLPEGLQEIEERVFEGCTSLQTIDLPEGLREIGWNAFEGCTSLQTIDLPEGLQVIRRYAFRGCTSLREVVLPEELQEIGKEAFQNCSIEELKIPRSVQMIEDHAFYGNKLKRLEIFIGYKDRIADIFGEIDEKIITWIN